MQIDILAVYYCLVLDNLHLKPLIYQPLKIANSLVTLGIRFCSLPSTTIQLVDFATKYLRKNTSLRVEIYSFLPIVGHEIARLVKNCFSISTV